MATLSVIAVGIYSLCCRPAWSPDSDKAAYICFMEEGERIGISVYDLATKKNELIVQASEGADLVPVAVFWPKHGHELLYVQVPPEDDSPERLVICSYDLENGQAKHKREVALPGLETDSVFLAFLEKDRWLWVRGENTYCKINIENGKWSQWEGDEGLLFGNSDEVFVVSGDVEEEVAFARLTAFLTVEEKELFTVSAPESGKLMPLAAVPEECVQFAYLTISEESATLAIVDEHGKHIKEIPLLDSLIVADIEENPLPMLAPTWNHDGTVLWFATMTDDGSSGASYAVAEVDVAAESIRCIPIGIEDTDGEGTFVGISLSPDQKYLAVTALRERKPHRSA